MSSKRRELIVLSDGTSNSASNPFKTNVWRLYQALNLRDGSQVAVFGDGVGTSSITILRVLGLALGIGVKRNVLNLYKFLCHNYRGADDREQRKADRIWMFGFSRGAFTIRVLAGLIKSQGLVAFTTEADLNQNAIAAYRAYRAEAFRSESRWFKNGLPWVRAARWCRDWAIRRWRAMTGGTHYDYFPRRPVRIHFIGVWDTVAAYGLPIDELTIAVDRWVWPMKFAGRDLLKNVDHARHAMAVDDERRTFHPIPWSEVDERRIQADAQQARLRPSSTSKDLVDLQNVAESRLLQVWFPGVHADVGGGYPDDGLSLVPLCWMIDEAETLELRFERIIVETYRAQASPTGRLYDNRSGYGALWRYQPRNAQLLMDDRNDGILAADMPVPLLHHSAMTRMTYGNDGYAPISLPAKIDIAMPDDIGVRATREGAVRFEKDAVQEALKTATGRRKDMLEDMAALLERRKGDRWQPSEYFELVGDTVWWRRCVYFVSLLLVLIALVYPVIYRALGWDDNSAKASQIASGTITYFAGLLKGVIPAFATPWVDAASQSGPWALLVVVAFLLSLAVSSFLQVRIHDRARGAWNIQPEIGGTGKGINRLKLTGQRRAFAAATFLFAGAALIVYQTEPAHRNYWLAVFFVPAVITAFCWFYRAWRPEKDVDPARPRWALWFARKARRSSWAVGSYRWVAQTGGPALFILLVAWIALGAINLGAFNLQSTAGWFCQSKQALSNEEKKLLAEGRYEKLGTAVDLDLKSPCAPTGLWLIAGREYRIQLEPTEPWFDNTWASDVTGFTAGWVHLAFTPLKRWWAKSWFQPVVRVGDAGNYDHALYPASPLPKVVFKNVPQAASPPVGTTAADAQIKRETDAGVVRNKLLIADITPHSTGEVFFYVNDAVVGIPFLHIHDWFYRNNIGKAKLTITRTVAPATIDAKGQ